MVLLVYNAIVGIKFYLALHLVKTLNKKEKRFLELLINQNQNKQGFNNITNSYNIRL